MAKKPATKSYTLDKLSELLGSADPELREALFEGLDEATLVEHGTKIDSDNIIKDMPVFIGMAFDVQKALSRTQRERLYLTPDLLPLLAAETVQLRKLKAEHDADVTAGAGGKAEREAAARQKMREGIALRDAVYDALRNAFGARGMAKVDEIVGTAETGEKLAAGMEALAGFIKERLATASPLELKRLAAFRIDTKRAKALEDKAGKIRTAATTTATPARRVTQRKLDLKDGQVLSLIERVLRAYRAANRQDGSIVVPELRTTGWLFDTGAGKTAKKKAGDKGGGSGES
jgi:hypothetical protein